MRERACECVGGARARRSGGGPRALPTRAARPRDSGARPAAQGVRELVVGLVPDVAGGAREHVVEQETDAPEPLHEGHIGWAIVAERVFARELLVAVDNLGALLREARLDAGGSQSSQSLRRLQTL